MSSMAARLIEAMTRSAPRQYGKEEVTELAHALQCADLAQGAGADEELVLACLLHDVGRYALAQDEVSDTLEIAASRSAATRTPSATSAPRSPATTTGSPGARSTR